MRKDEGGSMKESDVSRCCSFVSTLSFTALNLWVKAFRVAAGRFILHPSSFILS